MLKQQEYYTTYQLHFLLDFTFSLEDIAEDDMTRTVLEIMERIDIGKYIDLEKRKSHGYDPMMMLTLILLGMALFGYVSTRDLERLCRTDARFILISQGQQPCHMSFQRFMHDDLTKPIEDIFLDINRYIEKKEEIDVKNLYIDGTKYEANANKNTFVWRKNTLRYRTQAWKKFLKCIEMLNRYFKKQDIDIRYSILKEPSIDYMQEIIEKLELFMKDRAIEMVHGVERRIIHTFPLQIILPGIFFISFLNGALLYPGNTATIKITKTANFKFTNSGEI